MSIAVTNKNNKNTLLFRNRARTHRSVVFRKLVFCLSASKTQNLFRLCLAKLTERRPSTSDEWQKLKIKSQNNGCAAQNAHTTATTTTIKDQATTNDEATASSEPTNLYTHTHKYEQSSVTASPPPRVSRTTENFKTRKRSERW